MKNKTENVSRFIIWICRKFDRSHIEEIVDGLTEALKDPDSRLIRRDEFRENHPFYRDYSVDPTEPISKAPSKKKRKIFKRS